MESPTPAGQSVSPDISGFARAEVEAFVATTKRQRSAAWTRVEQLKQVCRDESPASAAGVERSRQALHRLAT